MEALRLGGHDLRAEFRLTEATPAVEAGFRSAIGLAVPVFAGLFTGQLTAGTLVALGCWFGLLVDVGGTYRQKAKALLAGILATAAAVLAGGLVRSVPGLHPFSGWLSLWRVAAMAEPPLGVLGANGLEPRINGGF
jgi:uncharacterized membrane protein YccC